MDVNGIGFNNKQPYIYKTQQIRQLKKNQTNWNYIISRIQ